MKESFFHQCTLECQLEAAVARVVSWIPAKFAVRGKTLKLKDNGVWTDGWKVMSVGTRLSKKQLPNPGAAIRRHRRRTGDSILKKKR